MAIQKPISLELCAGAGGQALGLEMAGFEHAALIENDVAACNTLRLNRPKWNIVEHDLFSPLNLAGYKGVELLAGGLPCPPFSIAGKQLGQKDERNLFDVGVNYVDEIRPKAVMFENVKGLLGKSFEDYRNLIQARLKKLGYVSDWRLLNSSDFGVSQLRPRSIMIAIKSEHSDRFAWPENKIIPPTVGQTLFELMASRGWREAENWKQRANRIAPTIVGGSKKHGGPDLGPTRARQAWALLGVNGKSLAYEAPDPDFEGDPRLTVPMVSKLQGFPDNWRFWGSKTAAYRQVGNAFPAPVAAAVTSKLLIAISSNTVLRSKKVA